MSNPTTPDRVKRAWTLMTGTPFEEPEAINDAKRSEWLRFYWTHRPTIDELHELVAWASTRQPKETSNRE